MSFGSSGDNMFFSLRISPLAFAKQYHRVKNNYFVIIEDEKGQRPGSLLIDVAWQD